MTTTTSFGTLTDYTTGDAIRPATPAEWRASADAANGLRAGGPTGAFEQDGRAVYVDSGPRAEVSDDDIRALRDAAQAGDIPRLALCQRALDEFEEDARERCAQVILDNRMQGE